MELFFLVKWVHVLSSTVLFGFGAGTAWYLWNAHLTGDPVTIARVGRMVVKADWIFTGGSGVVQPLSGIWLAHLGGYPLSSGWLVAAYWLYALAFACWIPVVWLQIRAQRLAEAAAASSLPLRDDYRRTMRWWFALGWPAFLALTITFWLMIARPAI